MKSFNLICPFFTFCVILSRLSSLSYGESIVGKAMCHTYGLRKEECKAEDMPVTSFPKECTSFYYSGLYVNEDGTVEDPNESRHPAGYLDGLGGLGKPVITTVVREPWWTLLKGMKKNPSLLDAEIKSFKAILEKHSSISAMAIYRAEMGQNDTEDSEYTSNLSCWILAMKNSFPNMKFGMFISVDALVQTDYKLKSLDLKTLDENYDFYRMQSTTDPLVLDCTSLDGKYGEMEMNVCNKGVQDYFNTLGISKDKIIWDVWASPMNNQMETCELTNENMCLNPNGTYCGNTLKGYYDKGAYFKTNAGGISMNSIDLDDANEVCKCGKFPVFNALYNGVTGGPEPKPCCLIDRPV